MYMAYDTNVYIHTCIHIAHVTAYTYAVNGIGSVAILAQSEKGDWQPFSGNLVLAMGVAMMHSNHLEDDWVEWDWNIVADDDYWNDLFVDLWRNAWLNSHDPMEEEL